MKYPPQKKLSIRSLTILLIASAAMLFSSCGKSKVPAERITIDNESALMIQKAPLETLIADNGVHLYVKGRRQCPKNDYLDDIGIDGIRYNIAIYEQPRLIKGSVEGLANKHLHRKMAHRYLQIQEYYANGGDANSAVYSMAMLLKEAYTYTSTHSNWFQRTFGDFSIDDLQNNITSILFFLFKPYNNFWGKVVMWPTYAIAYGTVAWLGCSGAVWFLSITMVVIFLILGLFQAKNLVRKGNDPYSRFQLATIYIGIFLETFLTVTAIIVRQPRMENIFVMKDIYGFDLDILTAYHCSHIGGTSFWLLLFTGILYTFNFISSLTPEKAKDTSPDGPMQKAANLVITIVTCMFVGNFIDKGIILAFFVVMLGVFMKNLLFGFVGANQSVRNSVYYNTGKWIMWLLGGWFSILIILMIAAPTQSQAADARNALPQIQRTEQTTHTTTHSSNSTTTQRNSTTTQRNSSTTQRSTPTQRTTTQRSSTTTQRTTTQQQSRPAATQSVNRAELNRVLQKLRKEFDTTRGKSRAYTCAEYRDMEGLRYIKGLLAQAERLDRNDNEVRSYRRTFNTILKQHNIML